MNDLSQDAWFYTQSGEKGGPVGFFDLQRMAKEGKLHPRLDLIWAKGMDRWQPAGEIQGLFDRQPPAVVPVVAAGERVVQEKPATVVPLAKTAVNTSSASPEEPYEAAGVIRRMPGARRRVYLFFLIVFPALFAAVLATAVTAAGISTSQNFGQETLAVIISGLLVLPVLVALVFSFMRLVNLGMSGWWFLGNFVPLLNLWIGYRCFACPAGYAIHKKMDRMGIFLAILYWLMILAGIAAVAALLGIVFGHMGPPELREQIVDAIRERLNMPATP